MKRCVLVFPAKGTGSGVQTVTGVSDPDTGAFIGEVVIFQSGLAGLNTLASGGAGIGTYTDSRGADNGSVRSALSASGLYSGFNFKAEDTGQSLGNHSIATVISDSFGSAVLDRQAKITAFRLGEFDITYDVNTRTGDYIIAIILAEIDVAFINNINGTYTTPSKPQGLIALPIPGLAASGGTSSGTGGNPVLWGFATRDGDYGAANLLVVNQGNNFSAQLTNVWGAPINGSTGVLGTGPTISAWNDLALTIANSGNDIGIPAVFCGDHIRTAGGFISGGASGFDTGLNNKLLFFISTGYAASGSVQQPIGNMCSGWYDGHTNVGFWAGEKTNGNTGTGFGARYLSNNSILRFGSPNGASTVFNSSAIVSHMSPSGPVTLSWTGTPGSSQILWFAVGLEITHHVIGPGEGIYKLVPEKRQDTIWFDGSDGSRYLKKLPDPNAFTALVGDE